MHMGDEPKKLISIKSKRVIQQSELEEFIELTKQLQRLENRWKQRRWDISWALRCGARVEMGMHEAFLSRLVIR